VASGAQTRRRGGDFLQHADAAQDTLLTLLQNAGFTPLTEPPYDDFSHFVEQAVHRDFIVARNEQP